MFLNLRYNTEICSSPFISIYINFLCREIEEQEIEEEYYSKILDVTKRELVHCKKCKMAVTEPPKVEYAR